MEQIHLLKYGAVERLTLTKMTTIKYDKLLKKIREKDRGVNNDEKLFIGSDGNTYLIYNSTTSRLELYVNSVKVKEWS